MGKTGLARRDFLNLAGMAGAGLALSACGAKAPVLSTPTLLPSATATRRPSTLRELADRAGFELGVAMEEWSVDERVYFDILKSDFNLTVINSGLYWKQFEPVQGSPDYSVLNRQFAKLLQFGLGGSLIFRGHPLYFPELNPDWLINGNFTGTQLAEILKAHVRGLVSYFKGIMKQWIVVNEPFLVNHPAWRPKDVCYQKLGFDYIDIAFQSAREADPSAILILNETDNHSSTGSTTRQAREIAARLKAKGLIDGVGCQMHLDGAIPPNSADLISTFQSYGLPVYVTEMDVDLSHVPGSTEERFAHQAKMYGDVLTACMDSGVCGSLAFWGIVDKYSWLEWMLGRPNADACLYDDDYQPKPAYFAIKEILEKYSDGKSQKADAG